MEEKIYQCLKQTFSAKYGVGDDVYVGMAKSLASTGLVTDENLATVIQGQETTLKVHQTNFDRWNTENSNYKKQIDELTGSKPKKTEPPKTDPDTQPALTAEEVAKIVAEAIKPYSDKITGFETTSATEKRNAEIATKAKEYGVSDTFLSRFNIPTDANLDEYFKGVQQDFANIGYEGVRSPESGKNYDTNTSEVANLINTGTEQIVKSKN